MSVACPPCHEPPDWPSARPAWPHPAVPSGCGQRWVPPNGKIKVTGTTGLFSYTLLTANSITGTPVLAVPVPGYELQIPPGNTELRLVQTGGDPYTTWANGGGAFDADDNGDGVKNGLAFLLGALSPTSAVTVPTVTQTSGNLVLSLQHAQARQPRHGHAQRATQPRPRPRRCMDHRAGHGYQQRPD